MGWNIDSLVLWNLSKEKTRFENETQLLVDDVKEIQRIKKKLKTSYLHLEFVIRQLMTWLVTCTRPTYQKYRWRNIHHRWIELSKMTHQHLNGSFSSIFYIHVLLFYRLSLKNKAFKILETKIIIFKNYNLNRYSQSWIIKNEISFFKYKSIIKEW